MLKKIDWFKLFFYILAAELTGALANFFSGDVRAVYESLQKPPLAPPGVVFGIIWPILYLLIGIAVYLAATSKMLDSQKVKAVRVFWLQLFVNFLWPIVFFRFMLLWPAVAVIVLLDVLVILMMIRFYKGSTAATVLVAPYLIWILFATYLNIGFAVLN